LREEEEGRALAYVASIFFSLGLAVFALVVFGVRILLKSARSSWAANWPTASGQVTTCNVKAIHGRFLDYALGVIGYSYQIDGNYYSGYLTRQFWDEQRAWTFVDACKNKSILVPYKLGKPQISIPREMDLTNALLAPQHRYDRPKQRFGPVLDILWSLQNVSDWAERRLDKEAQKWPCISGTVEYAEPIILSEDNYANWGGELHYSYSVDGKSYSNSYYLRAAGEEDARNQVERWRNGNVIVHYFAGNPARSVLILEEQTQYTPDTNE